MIKSGLCRTWMVAGFSLGLASCVPALQGPAFREPHKQTPERFATGKGSSEGAAATTAAQHTWQQFFAATELQDLIQVALANNQELNIRLQELVVALNEASARQGEYLPKIGPSVGVGVEKVGRFTSQGASDDGFNLPKNLGNFTFGLVGSWEADIFAKLRNAKKAADLRYFASVEGQKFLVTQIIAEIARSYYELVSIDSQLDIVQKSIRIQEDTLGLVKLEKQAARVTELAVQRFEADLLRYKSRVYAYEQERVQVENRINYLVGRFPQPVKRSSAAFLSQPPPVVETGLPSDLLENRTDVRQAELALAAAKLDVKAAKAAFYPSVNIEAGVGYRAFNVAHLVTTPASLFYDAAGGLIAPLINRKAIVAHYETANAKQVQAVYSYEKTLLEAFTDVANQIAAVSNWRSMYALLSEEVATLADAVGISSVLFQAARAEYIEVLTTRRDYLEAQLEMIEANKRSFLATVGVYQALGGGWRSKCGAPAASYVKPIVEDIAHKDDDGNRDFTHQ